LFGVKNMKRCRVPSGEKRVVSAAAAGSSALPGGIDEGYPIMVTITEARLLAQAHIDANPLPQPQLRHVLREPHELSDGWFFFYAYERVDGQPLDQLRDCLLGAAGFVVSKSTGEVEISTLLPPELHGRKRCWWRFWRTG
jgi:hypothetical protein